MGFDGSSVETMSYDFTSWLGGETSQGVPVAGVIPEPTVDDIERFQDFWVSQIEGQREAVEELRRLQAMPEGDRDAAAASAALDAVRQIRRELSTEKLLPGQMRALAELCQHHPSVEVLQALPYRVQLLFRDYVMGELVDGPKGRSGTSN